MNKQLKQLTLCLISILSLILVLFDKNGFLYSDSNFFYLETIFFSFIGASVFLLIISIYRDIQGKNSTLDKLNKLTKYNEKRKEIEKEINALTLELTNSDFAEYIDVNRLVFNGQNTINNKAINLDNFIYQFGIKYDEMKVKENSALFLSPFDDDGFKLFKKCQSALNDLNISLQMTDSKVEKDDILMNIILLIIQSELIIVNINGRNPNVYYELGIAHALGKPTILLSKYDCSNNIGFDIRQKRIIMYKDIGDLENQLLYYISKMKNNNTC